MIGIIAILASIVIVAINPTKQLGIARDAQRSSDVNTILNAVYQYAIDHNGILPAGIPIGTPRTICKTSDAVCNGGVNLRLLTGAYLFNIPSDPQATTGTGTNYTIVSTVDRRTTVAAPGAEQTASISLTR